MPLFKKRNISPLQQEIQALYAYYPKIENLLKKRGANKIQVEDIFQESLLIYLQKKQDKNFHLSSKAETYICGIALNLFRTESRKQAFVNFEKVEHQDFQQDISDFKEKEQKFHQMQSVLESIGEKCSRLLKLFYVQKFSMEEIADKLEYKNVNTAKNQKYKCLERAKKMAGEQLKSSAL